MRRTNRRGFDQGDRQSFLQLNIEFVRPEDFVPPLIGSNDRHLLIDTIGRVSFYHYDPYAQLLSKVVRGFNRDMQDAENFVLSGMVEPQLFRSLVQRIPDHSYAKYPALSRQGVGDAGPRLRLTGPAPPAGAL